MNTIVFDGQQTDEKILGELRPDVYTLAVALVRMIFILVFFYLVLMSIATVIPQITGLVQIWLTVIFVLFLGLSFAWIIQVYKKSVTYLTDRRIMRFDLQSPMYIAKRALFWNQALKAKAYQTNFFWRVLKIGTIEVEPEALVNESVRVNDILLFEDVANYIDKLIFIVKNRPEELDGMRPFVMKMRGKRY